MADIILDLCGALEYKNIEYKKQVLLSEHSTFRIGGYASVVAFPKNESELIEVVKIANDKKIKYTVIGNGSNILFSDRGYDGIIISTLNLKNIAIDGCTMNIECGASITGAAIEARKASLSGLEFAYGIPGTLGGAVFMNAGAYGSEISNVLFSVKVFDICELCSYEICADELELDYRSSIFMKNNHLIILSATLNLTCGESNEIEALMKDNMRKRQDKQPLNYPNAGSVFKRTQGYFMGKIIEESGLKGYTVGGAQVSEKHAGFIINKGGATAEDVLSLIKHIKSVLCERYAIDAECEIRYIEY